MFLKKVTTMILVAAMAVSLTACSKSDNSTVSTKGETGTEPTKAASTDTGVSATEEHEPVNLRFSWWGGDARHEATLAVIELFEKQYPWITIDAEYSSIDGYNDKLMTQFASGTAPDVVQMETGAAPEYHSQDLLYNLSETSIDFSNFDPIFLENNGQFGSGSQYSIPTGKAGSAIIVNKDLADEIGIDFTKQYDWDQLIEWGKQVQAYDPSLYLLQGNVGTMMPFIMRCMPRQLNALPIITVDNQLTVTEEQFTMILDYVKQLYDNNVAVPLSYIASYSNNVQDDPNWIAGKYVASVGYTSSADVLQAGNPNANYIAGCMPVYANAKSDGWANDTPQFMGIYVKTKYPEESALFLDFFFNNEEATKILGTVRSVPPTAKAQEIVTTAGTLNPLTKMSVDVSQQYKGFSDGGKTTSAEVSAILTDAYESVAYGAKSPSEAAKEVIDLIKNYLSAQ